MAKVFGGRVAGLGGLLVCVCKEKKGGWGVVRRVRGLKDRWGAGRGLNIEEHQGREAGERGDRRGGIGVRWRCKRCARARSLAQCVRGAFGRGGGQGE